MQNKTLIYIILYISFIVVPIIFSNWLPQYPKRYFIYYIIIISMIASELRINDIYQNQRKDMPNITEAIKVKIIAGKFTDGIFNSDVLGINEYPLITNEATIAFGETPIPAGLLERHPKYFIDKQLFEYLFLKTLSYTYHDGWYLEQEKPLKTESIWVSPQYQKQKAYRNIYTYEMLPNSIKAYNIYFNNSKIFKDGSYRGRKTITIFRLFKDPEPFKIVLPPDVKFQIEIDKDGWPTGRYFFEHRYCTVSITLTAFSFGPGYPIGFHKFNSRSIKEDMNKVRSSEMIVNFKAEFKQTLHEQELRDIYHWVRTLLNYFKFYFDYGKFEELQARNK